MNIGALYATIGVDISGLQRAVVGMNQVAQKLRTFGYLATATVTLPLVAAGKASLDLAKKYEFAMQKIVGLTGEAQASVDGWSESLLKMAPKVAKGPVELAEALYYISSSGIKGARAMELLEISARAASSGLGETKDVADVLSSALNAYAGTGLTAARAADILVAAVREGKGEASEFAKTMGQIIPIGAELGVSFDQIAGGMAAITLTGSSAATAAVYLKGVFNSFLKASPKGEKALLKVHSSYAELRKILRSGPTGLIDVMQKMRDITIGNEEAMSDILPNIRGLSAYLSIAGKNFKYNTDLMKRVTASTGSLGAAFAAVADTIKIKYDSAIAQAQVSMITLGKELATMFIPVLQWLVEHLQKLTDWFTSLNERQKKTIMIVLGVVAALGPLSLILATLLYLGAGAISLFGRLGAALIGLVRLLGSLGAAMLTNPLGLFLTAIGLIAGAIFLLVKRLRGAKEEIVGIGDELEKNRWQEIMDDFLSARKLTTNLSLNKDVMFAMTEKQLEEQLQGYQYQITQYEKTLLELQAFKNDNLAKDEEYINMQYHLTGLEKSLLARRKALADSNIDPLGRKKALVSDTELEILDYKQKMHAYQNRTVGSADQRMKDVMALKVQAEADKKIFQDYYDEKQKQMKDVQKIIDQRKQMDEDIDKAWEDLYEGLAFIDKMKQIEPAFDSSLETLNLYKSVIEALAKTDLPLWDTQFQKIIATYKKLNATVDEGTAILSKYKEEMAVSTMKGFILGNSFDRIGEQIRTAEKALDDYLGKNMGKLHNLNFLDPASLAQALPILANVKMLMDEINKLKKEEAQREDQKALRFLDAQTKSFHGMENQVELLNQQLQIEERYLRRLGEDEGFTANFEKQAKVVADLRNKIRDLNDAYELKGAIDMANAFKTASYSLELINTEIGILTQRMQELSRTEGGGQSSLYAQYADDINKLTRQADTIDLLTNSLQDLFSISEDGFKNFGEYIKEWALSVVSSIQRLIVAKLVEKVVGVLFPAKNILQTSVATATLATTNGILTGSEMAKTGAMVASTAATQAASIAAADLAITSAAAAGALVPFPGNLISIPTSVGAAIAALAGGKAAVAAMGAIPLAEGGIIPPGYKNDTFPAMLSSGEAVIPLDKLNLQKEDSYGEVVFEIKGDRLVGILKKEMKKSSIY